jgi:VanZ family protein
VKEQIQKELT